MTEIIKSSVDAGLTRRWIICSSFFKFVVDLF